MFLTYYVDYFEGNTLFKLHTFSRYVYTNHEDFFMRSAEFKLIIRTFSEGRLDFNFPKRLFYKKF